MRTTSPDAALDRTDLVILGLLQDEARLAVKEGAAAVGLAPFSVHGRIRHLRDTGVLRGAHAEVAPRALGIGLEALPMIGLSKHKRDTVDRFLDDAVTRPGVGGGLDVTRTALDLGCGSTPALVYAFRTAMGCSPQACMRGRRSAGA